MKKKLFVVIFTVVLGLAISCAKKEEAPKAPAATEEPAPVDTMKGPAADTTMVK